MDRVTKEGTPRPPTTAAPSSKMRLQKQLMPLKDSRPTATNCETHSGQLLLPSSASSFSPSSCCASLPSASSPSLSASSSPLWVGPKEGSSSTPPSVPVGSSFNASLPASSRSPSSLFRDTDERRQRRNEFPTNRKEIEAARNMQARRIDPYSCEVNRIEREAWRASSAAAEAASVVLTAARCLRRASTRQRGERLDCEVSPAEGVSAATPPQNATSRISVEANLFASPGGVAPPEAFSVPLKKKSSVTDSDDGASPAEFPSSPPFEPESSRPPTSSSSPLSSPLSSSSPYYLKAPVYIRPSPPEASSLDPSPSAVPSDFPRAGCSVASSLSPSSESHAALTASASWASPPQSPGLASSALKTASVSASQATNSTHILRRGGAALTSPHAPPDLPLQSRGPRGNQMCEDDASNASPPCRHRIAFASSASASSAESDLPAPARTHANRYSCTVKLSAAPSMFSATASTCASLSVSSASLSHAPRKPNERASRGPNSRALPVGHTKERRNSKRGGSRNHVETKRCEEASEPSHERRRALEGENEERKSAACNPSSAGMSQGCPSTTAAKRKQIESFYLEANLAEEPANYDCRARGEPRRPTSSQDCQPLSLQRRALPATQNRERVETPAGADRKARRMADAAQATGGNVKPRRTSRERTAEELYGFMYVIYVERLKTKMNHAAEEGKAKSRNHSHGDTEKASPDARRSSRFSERRDRKASCRRESEKGRMQTLQLVATTKSLGLEVAVASCALETVPGRLSSRVPADEPRAKPASVETRFASFLVVPGRGSEPADVGGNLKRANARPLRPADVTLCLEILDAQRIPLIRGVLRLPGSGASEHFFKHRVLLTPAFASPRHGTPHDDAGQTVASVLVAAQKRWTQLRGSSGRFQLANQPLHFALEQRDPQARYLTQALPFLSSLPPAVSRASKKGLDAPTEYALAAANSSAMESTTPHKASATAASALNVKVSRDRHTTVDRRSLLLPSPAQDGVAEQHVKATPPTPADAPSPLFPRMPSGNSMPPPLSLGSSESASAFAFSDSLAQTRAREALTKDRHVANDLRLDCNDSNTSAALSAGSGRSPHASLRVRRPRRGEAETLGMAESAASPSCLMPNSTSLPCGSLPEASVDDASPGRLYASAKRRKRLRTRVAAGDEAGESFQWSLSEDGSEGAVCGTDAREGGAGDWAKGDDEGGKNGVAMPRKAEEICESEKGGRQLKPESSWAEQQPDRCARNRQGQVGTATSKKSEKPLERQALRERITDRQAQIKSLKTRLDRLKGLSSPAQDFREDGGTALQRGRRSETEVERSGEKRPETDVDLDAAAATLQSVNPDEAQTPKGEAFTLTAEPRVTATAEANSSAGGGRAPKVGGGFVGAAASSSPSPLASSACASLSPPSALAIVASDSSAAYQISSVSSALPTVGASPATRGASPSFSPLPAAKVHLQREPEEAPRSCMLREEGEIAQSGEQTGRRECSAAGPRAAWVASAVLRDEAGAMKQTHATLPQARPDATPAQSPEGLRKARMPSDQTKRNAGELCDETSDGPQDSLSSQKTDRGNLSPGISLAASSARLLHADMTPAFAAHSARDGRDALDPSFKVSPLGSASLEPASSALSPLSAACSLVSQPPTSRASPSDSRPPALSSSPAAPASTSLRHAPSPAETLLPRTATSAADLFGARAASLGEQPMSRGKQQRVIVAGNVIEIFCSQGTAKSQRHPRGAPSSELAASCDSATARDTAASQETLSRERGAEVQGGERPCQGGTNRPDGVQAQISAPESGDVSYASGESERIQESDWQRRHRVELQEAGAFAHGGGAVEEIVLGRVNAARSNEESCADPASRHQLAQPSEPGAELPQIHEEADKMHAAHEPNSESIALRVTAVSHLACVSRATARTCGALRGALSLDNAQECDEALSSPRAGRAGIQAAETKRVKDEDRRDRRQEGRREEGREEEGQEEEGREEAGGEEEGDEASIGRDSHARNQRSSHGVEAHDFSREAAVREGISKAGDEASTSLAAQSKGQPAFHQVASADDYAAQTLEVRDGARPVHGDSRVPEEPRLSQIPSQPRERGNESGRRGGAARAAAFFESRLSQCLASRAFAEARRNLRMLASHRRMPLLRRLLSLRGADVDAVLYSELRALLALPVSLAEAASPLAQRGTAPSVLSPSAALLQNEATRREGAISVAPSAVTRAESLDARRVNSNGDAGNDESPCGRADPSRLRGDHSKRVDFSSAAPAAPAEKEEHAAWPWTSCPRAPAEGECGERRGRERPQHPEAAADAYDGRRLGAGATHARANEDDRHRSDSGSTGVQAGRRHVAMKGHTAEEGDALLACLLDAVEYAAGLCGAKVSAAKHSAPQAPPREPATESGGDPRGAQSADASFVSSPFSVSPFPSAASCLSTRPPHASSCSCSCLRRASAPSAVRWAPAASHPSPTGSCPSEANLVASPTGFPSRVSSPAASSSSLLFEASSGQQAWSGNASISPPTAAPSSSVGVCRLAAPSLTRALSARRYSQPIFRATWAPEAEFERRQQHVVTRVSRLKEKISRLANAMSRELPWSEGCATWDEAHARRAASCSPQRQRADSPFAAPQMEAHLPFASPSESFALSAAFTDSPVAAPWRLVARPHAMSPSPWPASSPWLLPRIQFEAAVATPPFAPRAGATSPAFPPEAGDAKTDELRLREWRCWDAGEPYAGNATDTKACEGEGTSAETEREQRQRGRQRHNRGTSAWPPPRRIADCEWTGGDGARTTSPASESSFSVLPRSAKIVERLTDLRLAQETRRSDKGESASGLAELERSPEQKVPRCASPGSSPTGILSLHQGLPKDAPTDASSLGQTAVDGSFAGDAVALWKLPQPDKSSPREGRQPRMRASVNDGSSAGSCMRERECLNTEKQSQNGQQRISAESEPHACGGRDAASKSVASRSGRQGEICQERDTDANANDLFSQPGGGGPQHELTPSAGKNAEETNAKQCCKSQHEEPAGTTTHAGACNEDNASLAISPLGSGSDLHQRRARLVRQEARLSLVAKKIQILQTNADTACSEACLRSILEEQLALLREQHEAAREEKPVKRP